MTPFEYISTKIFVRLKPSRIQGIGVFAIKDIPFQTNPFEVWNGDTGLYPILESELLLLPNELYTHIKDIFLYGPDFPSDNRTYVKLTKGCHWIYTTPYYFINSGLNKSNIDKDTFLTNRIIYKGEELLSNYGRYERFNKKDLL
jgi:hypothetical protein